MELLQLRKLMGQHRTQLPRPFSLPADASEKHQFLADLLPTLTKGAGLETALGVKRPHLQETQAVGQVGHRSA